MISYFAPPYRLSHAVKAALNEWGSSGSLELVERLFAETIGARHALILPSARAGILWGLKSCGVEGMRVRCPMFTCSAVWEAVFRSGSNLDGVDVAPGGFLMDGASFSTVPLERHALILSEIYGHTYDLRSLNDSPGRKPDVRIVDLAGGLLHQDLITRLRPDRDLAVISFGRGSKALYCGWGGMAFTQDSNLAEELRKRRDADWRIPSRKTSYERSLRLLFVSLVRTPLGAWIRQTGRRAGSSAPVAASTAAGSTENVDALPVGQPGPEFVSAPTLMEQRLMGRNLHDLDWHIERRRALVSRYERNLAGLTGVVLPPKGRDVLSHYTIRVPGIVRNAIFAALNSRGVEAGRLFFFSPRMREYQAFVSPSPFCRSEYPHALQVSSEVLNLPLHPRLSADQVDAVCEQLRCALAAAPDANGLSASHWPAVSDPA